MYTDLGFSYTDNGTSPPRKTVTSRQKMLKKEVGGINEETRHSTSVLK